ncbi:XrtA-associated tyrosine autokinase (plasmid) [Photobacterium sp. GJ3]|uniref:XrtA-associated tyrosine autokinase n=1 Tax=Photobacterium sp. GJ3 TaxID=2829502 RepID=UPI001B8D4185|nr:XrtA-associated tyrosine autokinase [Photobacterium sp. GJ3]QUJ69301.1 XrtA-associated tyrosine autokinase [Photobacterium sp. GJ3]
MSIIQKAMEKTTQGNQGQSKAKTSEKQQGWDASSNNQTRAEGLSQPSGHTGLGNGFPPAWHPPAVIEIDIHRLQEMGMVSHTNEKANVTITNEYRAIKQKLFHNAFSAGAQFHQRANLVMVTSASPQEGKTFTAVNLALSMSSEKDKTVLLVDADVLKPGVSDLLGIETRPGLIDFLQGQVSTLSEIIYPTSIPNLRIIPAGQPHHLSNELLASNKMERLMNELAHRYPDRMVIFDCPPVLGVVETMTLSKLLGQALFVVEQDKSRLDDIEAAVSQLNKDMAIGFVMNKAVRNVLGQYRHGHDYGATEDQS